MLWAFALALSGCGLQALEHLLKIVNPQGDARTSGGSFVATPRLDEACEFMDMTLFALASACFFSPIFFKR